MNRSSSFWLSRTCNGFNKTVITSSRVYSSSDLNFTFHAPTALQLWYVSIIWWFSTVPRRTLYGEGAATTSWNRKLGSSRSRYRNRCTGFSHRTGSSDTRLDSYWVTFVWGKIWRINVRNYRISKSITWQYSIFNYKHHTSCQDLHNKNTRFHYKNYYNIIVPYWNLGDWKFWCEIRI